MSEDATSNPFLHERMCSGHVSDLPSSLHRVPGTDKKESVHCLSHTLLIIFNRKRVSHKVFNSSVVSLSDTPPLILCFYIVTKVLLFYLYLYLYIYLMGLNCITTQSVSKLYFCCLKNTVSHR